MASIQGGRDESNFPAIPASPPGLSTLCMALLICRAGQENEK